MKGLFKKIGQLASLALPVAMLAVEPAAAINVAVGSAVKHGTKISNNSIPILNFLVSTGVSFARHGLTTGDWAGGVADAIQQGAMLTGASTAIHQTTKIPVKAVTGRSL